MATSGAPKSPFFRPRAGDYDNNNASSTSFVRTPGGTTFRKKKNSSNNNNSSSEQKSTILGCSSNLVNAIVGAGIVGLPFAIQESGLVPGLCLVLLSAALTEKSLRLLIETAKHASVPSYETLAEAAYGNPGFWFVTVNMFVMAYGAMLTYLMIVKDVFSSLLGVAPDDAPMRRATLITISSLIILPLSCQRDMASLAKTSKMNVLFDLAMVTIVVYLAFHQNNDDDGDGDEGDHDHDYDDDLVDSQSIGVHGYVDTVNANTNIEATTTTAVSLWHVRWDTIFVGLGVLSFAFVCQHSAFIIAGSLENPTKERWSRVTGLALSAATCLAMVMGVSGYLGFGDYNSAGSTHGVTGNILNSLPPDSTLARIAKGLLGTTMIFVYPMESFVARHACVVLLFQGRKAHEGDDTSVLNRRDRRITLTVVLYVMAVVPAAVFEDLGDVLAITGGVGGSSLSYIGPGIVYIGIHGGRFLELVEFYFGRRFLVSNATSSSNRNVYDCDRNNDEESAALVNNSDSNDNQAAATTATTTTTPATTAFNHDVDNDDFCCRAFKFLSWYLLGMPLWTTLASIGKNCLTNHVTELALRSPHPIRIGNVRFARAKVNVTANVSGGGGTGTSTSSTRVVVLQSPAGKMANASAPIEFDRFGVTTRLLRADSCPKISSRNNNADDYQSINQKIGAMAVAAAQKKGETPNNTSTTELEEVLFEEDPQGEPPGILDFAIAIFYVLFGLTAFVAGLSSVF